VLDTWHRHGVRHSHPECPSLSALVVARFHLRESGHQVIGGLIGGPVGVVNIRLGQSLASRLNACHVVAA
jgi:hypothetical protein